LRVSSSLSKEFPMKRRSLERAVAAALGESLAAIRRLGFGRPFEDGSTGEPDGASIRLVLDCPFCGHAVAHPGAARCGSAAMAECDRCDVYFGFDETEVYVAPAIPTDRAA
jgi:hypothetical protein